MITDVWEMVPNVPKPGIVSAVMYMRRCRADLSCVDGPMMNG